MLLDVQKVTEVSAPTETTWGLIRDVPRLSACIPGVSDLAVIEADRRYSANVSDRLGPFRLEVPVEIELRTVEEPRRIVAELSGNDSRGQARVRGTLEASLEPSEAGSRLALGMRVEVLGRLAALGAAPMRRRADEIFNQFVRCVSAELGAD
jgi:uncharacterized protein